MIIYVYMYVSCTYMCVCACVYIRIWYNPVPNTITPVPNTITPVPNMRSSCPLDDIPVPILPVSKNRRFIFDHDVCEKSQDMT